MKTVEEIIGEVDRIRMKSGMLSMSPDTPLIHDLATSLLDLLRLLSKENEATSLLDLLRLLSKENENAE